MNRIGIISTIIEIPLSILGVLMHKSHESLRDDYDVSSDALNTMVDCASAHQACYGARMTGAGFGGCAVAVVEAAQVDDFVKSTATGYHRQAGPTPSVYVCRATAGTELLEG